MKHRTVANGDGTPMWVPIEPDPDEEPVDPYAVYRVATDLMADRPHLRLINVQADSGPKCPHNCKGCTCRTDPRQMVLPFEPK